MDFEIQLTCDGAVIAQVDASIIATPLGVQKLINDLRDAITIMKQDGEPAQFAATSPPCPQCGRSRHWSQVEQDHVCAMCG